MAGISDKAVKTQYAQNKYRYNGKELQNQEFADGNGLEEYDYGARMQDPQLGIWHGIDSHLEFYESVSPYSYGFNNPFRYFDISGQDPGDILIFFTGANIGQPRTASTGWMANQVSRFINGGTTQTYRSRPFGSWYWNNNTNDAYDAIVENHKNYPDGRVVIYGYSYGGQLANYLAKRLDKIGIKVDLLITTDAAAGTSSNSVDRTISGNVVLNVNFFEYLTTSIDPLPNHGAPNTAISKATTVLNFDMTGQKFTDDAGEEKKINHITIDDASKAASVNYIMAVLPPRAQQKPMSIEDWLSSAGIQWQYGSSQSQNNQSNSGQTDFKILFGVY